MKNKEEELDEGRFKLADNLDRMDSQDSLNIHAEQLDSGSDNSNNLDNPDLYFGDVAKDKFWDFYKSERKFKDFKPTQQIIEDPR